MSIERRVWWEQKNQEEETDIPATRKGTLCAERSPGSDSYINFLSLFLTVFIPSAFSSLSPGFYKQAFAHSLTIGAIVSKGKLLGTPATKFENIV